MISLLSQNPTLYLMVILIVVFSVSAHEYAHARAALWQGDSTAADLGHLTLNPIKQMGIISLVMLFVIGIAWGQVPVNPSRMKHRYSAGLVAFAGPFTNIMLFIVFSLSAAIISVKGFDKAAFMFFSYGAVMNIVLFLFNMIPVPPLDGYTVIGYLFPGINNINQELKNGAIFLLFIMLFFSFRYIMEAGFRITEFLIRVFISALSAII